MAVPSTCNKKMVMFRSLPFDNSRFTHKLCFVYFFHIFYLLVFTVLVHFFPSAKANIFVVYFVFIFFHFAMEKNVSEATRGAYIQP